MILKSKKGSSVVEALAAVMLISIAVVSFTEIALTSIRNNTKSQTKIIAAQVADTYLNSLTVSVYQKNDLLVSFFNDSNNYELESTTVNDSVTTTTKESIENRLIALLNGTIDENNPTSSTLVGKMLTTDNTVFNGVTYNDSNVNISLVQYQYSVTTSANTTENINTYKIIIEIVYNNNQKEVIERDLYFE